MIMINKAFILIYPIQTSLNRPYGTFCYSKDLKFFFDDQLAHLIIHILHEVQYRKRLIYPTQSSLIRPNGSFCYSKDFQFFFDDQLAHLIIHKLHEIQQRL